MVDAGAKSTLLNMIGALDTQTSGEVWVAGEDLATVHSLDVFRARPVGFVFRLHNLLPTLSAVENVEVPMIGGSLSRSGETLLELFRELNRDERATLRELLKRYGHYS